MTTERQAQLLAELASLRRAYFAMAHRVARKAMECLSAGIPLEQVYGELPSRRPEQGTNQEGTSDR